MRFEHYPYTDTVLITLSGANLAELVNGGTLSKIEPDGKALVVLVEDDELHYAGSPAIELIEKREVFEFHSSEPREDHDDCTRCHGVDGMHTDSCPIEFP